MQLLYSILFGKKRTKMKEPSAALVALFLFIIIPGTICKAGSKCKNVFGRCHHNNDCCSQYCYKSFSWINGACKEIPVKYVNEDPVPKPEEGVCEFHMQPPNTDETNDLIEEFGTLHAAHETLPPYTQIMLTYKNKSIRVTINDLIPESNGTLLDVSNGVAKKLHIKNGEFVRCKFVIIKGYSSFVYLLCAIPIMTCLYGIFYFLS